MSDLRRKVIRRCETCGNLHRASGWQLPSGELEFFVTRCPACKLLTSIARHTALIANLQKKLGSVRGSAGRTSLKLRLKLGPSSAKLVDGHVDYLEEPTR